MLVLLFKLIIGHTLVDFVLQPTSMAMGKCRSKNSTSPPSYEAMFPNWYYWLTAHALIHGGAVWLITESVWLGLIECVLHGFIDFAKCEDWTNIHADQILHLLCKGIYVCLLFLTGGSI